MNTEIAETDGQERHEARKRLIRNGYSLAGALLREDRWKILPYLFVLSLFPIIREVLESLSLPGISLGAQQSFSSLALGTISYSLIDEVIGLLFLAWLAASLSKRFPVFQSGNTFLRIKTLLTSGLFLWILVGLPAALQAATIALQSGQDELSLSPILFLFMAIGIGIYFSFFFFFMPALLGSQSLRETMLLARNFTLKDGFLPFRVTISPIACMIALQALILYFLPDGRYPAADYLIAATTGLQRLLVSYLQLAFGLAFLDQASAPKDAYTPAVALAVIAESKKSPVWLSEWLSLKRGVVILGASLLLWSGYMIKLDALPPTASIAVQSIQSQDQKITLTISVQDEQFLLRGFSPAHFSLAGEKRTILSPSPESVVLLDKNSSSKKELPAWTSLPPTAEKLVLEIVFIVDRTKEEIQKLEDLHLWYRGVMMTKEPFKMGS